MDTVRIVLVSDNHGDRQALRYLKTMYADYDYFVHCGDSAMTYGELEGFICVRGNHDFALEGKVPDHLVLEIGGHRIYVCHGHMDFLSYFHYEPMAAHAKENDCDLVFFGHVHTCADVMIDGIRMLNPGSIWHNRDGTRPSYMLVHITGKDVQAVPMTYQAKNTTDGNSWLDRLLKWLSSL